MEKLLKPINWLITGGCGFIGINLIKNLVLEGGHYIRIFDNLSVGTQKDLSMICDFTEIKVNNQILKNNNSKNNCELIVGDIRDKKLCLDCTKDIDVIVHLAANTGVESSVKDPGYDMEINVYGTFNILEAAKYNKIKRFIFASSGAPIGECEPPIHEELPPHPVSPYGASKLAGEGYCSAFYRTFGLETVVLRFGNVYGPGSRHKNSVIAKFIKKAIAGETFEIYGDGTQTRDFIYIDDLIQAIRLSQSTKDIGGEIFQIATNKETTIDEMIRILFPILENMGFKNIKLITGENRLGDIMRNFSDTSKAYNKLKWEINTKFSSGLEKTVIYFITNSLI